MLNATTSREMECEDLKGLLAKISMTLDGAANCLTRGGYPRTSDLCRERAEECRVAAGYARATHYSGDERDQT